MKSSDHYQPMKFKILASMLLVPFFPFLLATVVGFYYFSEYARNITETKLQRIVNDHGHIIETFLASRRADLAFVADSYQFEDLFDENKLERIFVNLNKKSDAFVDLGVFDHTGLHVAYHGPYRLAGKMYDKTQWFREVIQKGYYISDIYLGFRNVPHFVVAIAKTEMGKTWVLRATIDTQAFTDVVEEIRVGKTGEAYIINEQGAFQTSRRSGGDLLEKDPDAPRYPVASVGSRPVRLEDSLGNDYIVVTSWLKDHQWRLVVRQARSDAYQELRRARLLVIIISFLGGILLLATALYMSGRIVNRIKKVDQEKVSLDQQLVMAGRLAEIGEMSSGFAHEINNPLQIIRAETSLIEMILPDLEKRCNLGENEDFKDIGDSVRQIQLQVERCADITAAILKFARKKAASAEKTDLAAFVPQVCRMVSKKAEVEGVVLTQDIPEDVAFPVNADQSQFQQVLLNLINNAMYAVTSLHGCSGKGTVTVSVSHRDNRVAVAVSDNGIGIAEENMDKIFTPFFSTKPVGHGTGLGLSICYGIINKMGGTIEVKSGADRGTTFTVLLPLAV